MTRSTGSGRWHARTDLRGRRFHRLIVRAYGPPDKLRRTTYVCDCDCGTVGFLVASQALIRNATKSCGCFRREHSRKMGSTRGTHGMYKTPEYAAWNAMVRRCTVPTHRSWARYGGRGITVCPQWLKFENFFADMGVRPSSTHSIERKKNDAGYEPNNCIWGTKVQQMRNRSNTRKITFEGRTLPLMEWAEKTGLPHYVLRSRLKAGWPIEEAITTQLSGTSTTTAPRRFLALTR